MNTEIVGYFWAMHENKTGWDGFMAPLAYGQDCHPSPELLMRDRGATLFSTKQKAEEKLKASLEEAISKGHQWPHTYCFTLVPVMRQKQQRSNVVNFRPKASKEKNADKANS